MSQSRRQFLLHAGAVAASLAGSAPAGAADATPLKMIVPYPAGGPADIIARAISQPLAEELGRPIVIDNRAGASGTIGAAAVAKSPPDGNTLLLNPSIHVILPSLQAKMPYDAVKDFTHLGVTAGVPLILAVNNDLPVKTVEELVAYCKSHPAAVSFATPGQGSSSHLAGEQFKLMAGLDIQQVPYKGSAPAITDLVGGQVQMMFDSLPSILPFVKGGKVRALAVTTPARVKAAPKLPTMQEAGFAGFSHTNWYGVWGAPGLPEKVSEPLIRALQKTMARKDVRERLLELGAEPIDGIYGKQFEAFAAGELARFGTLVKQANLKLD